MGISKRNMARPDFPGHYAFPDMAICLLHDSRPSVRLGIQSLLPHRGIDTVSLLFGLWTGTISRRHQARQEMSSFTSVLCVTPRGDGRTWKLTRPFTYHIGTKFSRHYIRVAVGFETDFASIPKFVFWLLPWWAKFNKSSVLHDWLYQVKVIKGKSITRKEADDVFLEAMLLDWEVHNHHALWAYIEYWVVRFFGFRAWH